MNTIIIWKLNIIFSSTKSSKIIYLCENLYQKKKKKKKNSTESTSVSQSLPTKHVEIRRKTKG